MRLHFLALCKVSFCVRVLGALQWAKNSVGSVGKVSGCVNRYAVSSRVTYNTNIRATVSLFKKLQLFDSHFFCFSFFALGSFVNPTFNPLSSFLNK